MNKLVPATSLLIMITTVAVVEVTLMFLLKVSSLCNSSCDVHSQLLSNRTLSTYIK